MSVEFLGVNKLMTRLARLNRAMDDETADALKDNAVKIRDFAKQIVPVDTSSLKRSIRVQRFAKKKGKFLTTGVSAGGYIINPKTGRRVDYASYVEFGTSKMKAQPYMRPALAKYGRKLPKDIKKRLRE